MEPVDQGGVGAALRAAADARDWDAVVTIIDAAWIELFHRFPRTLLWALDEIPDALADRNARLRAAREYVARTLHAETEPTGYRYTIGTREPTDVVDSLALITGQIAAARWAGRAEEVVALIARAHEILRAQPVQRHPELAQSLAELHYHWGLALERSGDFDAALADYVESLEWAQSTGHRMMQAAAGGAIAYIHALHGRMLTARRWLDKQPSIGAAEWWSPQMTVQARLAASLVRSADLAWSHVDPLEAIEPWDFSRHWAPYYFTRALAVVVARQARLLRNEIDNVLVTLPVGQRNDAVNAGYVDVARLVLAARAGELSVGESEDRPNASAPYLRQLAAVVRAVSLARAGKRKAALKLAGPLLDVHGSRPRVLVLALLVVVTATDDPVRRNAALEEAVAVAHAHGYHGAFVVLRGEALHQAADLLEDLDEHVVAQRLRAFGSAPTGDTFSALTKRERAVVEHAVAGDSVSEIAAALTVSVNTVKSQLRTAYRKLGVSSRRELFDLHHRLDGE